MGAACWGAGAVVRVKEQVLGPFDPGPVRGCGGLGEEDVFGWFVDAGNVGHELVPDMEELEVRDEPEDLLVGGVVLGVEHSGPEPVCVLGGCHLRAVQDSFPVMFDGGRVLPFVGHRRENDLIGGRDGAAAVDEFCVDL